MAEKPKRKRRTKAQIAADKAKEFKHQKAVKEQLDKVADTAAKINEVIEDQKAERITSPIIGITKNPEIRFLKKNGKPSLLTLSQCLDAQTMKERAYALGYAETFADPEAEVKTKGIDYKGEDAWAIIQRTYL
jgi:hypothetical protein